MTIEELMNIQVITSTQEYVPILEVPSTTFVITGDQIRRWGIRRLSELMERLVPGAIAAEDVDDIILSFRGITSDNNQKVQLLLNGHEYNTQWNNGPSSEADLGLMDDIERVEFLIGPHTAVYGSSAVLGVINMITKNGRNFSGIEVNANYGSGDYKKGGLLAGGVVNENLDYFVSAGGLTADGYDNNNNSPLNISRFPPSWRFFGNIQYHDFEIMSRFTRSSRDFYTQQRSSTTPNVWTNYDTFFVNARRSFTTSSNLRHVLDLSYDSIQTQRHDFTLGTKLRAVGENRYSVKFTSFYSHSSKNRLLLGGYYRRDVFGDDWEGDNFNFRTEIKDGQVTGIPVDPYTKRVLTPYGRNAFALFGQETISLGEYYSILLGFRFDRLEAPQIRHPNSFSPRVALVIKPNEHAVFKAMFSSGASNQLGGVNTSPDAIGFGNTIIVDVDKPERLNSIELAASYHFNPQLELSLNAFYNSFRDILGVDPRALPQPPFRLINAGRIDYVGFEAIASAYPFSRLMVRGVHQHVQFGDVVRDVFRFLPTPDHEHPSNYPQNVTKLLCEFQVNNKISVNGNANLVWNNFGTSPEGNTQDTGFYSTVNANLVWQPYEGLEFVLSGYNLFDQRKRIPPFFLPGVTTFAFLAERNFNINLGYRF
jgi:outer membrane receptor protein involved in Fe transport